MEKRTKRLWKFPGGSLVLLGQRIAKKVLQLPYRFHIFTEVVLIELPAPKSGLIRLYVAQNSKEPEQFNLS